ncbi:MAG: UDP-glucose 4-epimerase GalE [Hyphomicrobiaceae bacterium]
MPTLVTGGAGYIGSHMTLELLDAGSQVVVVDDLSTGLAAAVPETAQFVRADIADQALLQRLIKELGIDAILHFAGSVVVPDSVANPLAYYLNNTVKSRTLIETAIATGVRHFIFSSTAAVYGMPGSEPVAEQAALKPLSPYGNSKLMTEMMLADAARAHELSYVVLRYFNVAGADPQGRSGQSTPRATHLIKVACEAALGKRSYLEVFGTDYPTPDGTCVRDYIQVSDLARAHSAALAYLRAGGASETFNCGYGRGFSVLEVVEAVKRVSGRSFDVRLGPRRPGDPAQIVATSAKIRNALGWAPAYQDLDVIVRQALAWEDQLGAPKQAS